MITSISFIGRCTPTICQSSTTWQLTICLFLPPGYLSYYQCLLDSADGIASQAGDCATIDEEQWC